MADLEQQIRTIAEQVLNENSSTNQFAVSQTPYHTHNNSDSPAVAYPNLVQRSRYIIRQVVGYTASNTVANGVGGNFVMPFDGNFNTVIAYVDTAGTTGTMAIDVLLNGVTIFFSAAKAKLSIASGATASNSIVNFSLPNFVLGDVLTFNVTSTQTTAALGLTLQLRVTEISQ